MKKSWMFFISVVVCFSLVMVGYSAEEELDDILKTNWDDYGLKGKVKTCVQDKMLTTIRQQFTYEFNREGQIILNKTTWTQNDKTTMHQMKYSYDNKGLLNETFSYNGENKTPSKILHIFGKNRLLKELKYLNTQGKQTMNTVYHYDAQGRKKKVITFDKDGAMVYENKYQYNYKKKQHSREHFQYDNDGKRTPQHKYIYTLNTNGKTKLVEQYSQGKLTYAINFKYNAKENLILQTTTDVINGKIIKQKKFDYMVDKFDNWIIKNTTTTDATKKVTSKRTTTRKITYYKSNK